MCIHEYGTNERNQCRKYGLHDQLCALSQIDKNREGGECFIVLMPWQNLEAKKFFSELCMPTKRRIHYFWLISDAGYHKLFDDRSGCFGITAKS